MNGSYIIQNNGHRVAGQQPDLIGGWPVNFFMTKFSHLKLT